MQLLDLLIPTAYAQQAGAAPLAQSPLNGFLMGPGFIILMVVMMFFMVIRPQMRRSKEAKDMMSKLAKGDEIIVTGGLAGRIASIGEVYLSVEIAPGVEVKVQKSAVTTVLPKGTLKAL